MTKYYNERHKFERNNDTPISLPNYSRAEENKTYYCNYCNRNLSRLTNHTGDISYYCSFCSIETNPEDDKLRSKGKITMSEGPIEEPSVAYAPERGLKRKTVEYKGGTAALAKKGSIKITGYVEGKG